jgi:rhamnose transport system substrate-binding protein
MKKVLEQPEYAKLKLVATVYGDDQSDKSYREAIGLLRSHPQPESHHRPDHGRHRRRQQGRGRRKPGRQGLRHRPRPAVGDGRPREERRGDASSRSGTRSTWATPPPTQPTSSSRASRRQAGRQRLGRPPGQVTLDAKGEAALGRRSPTTSGTSTSSPSCSEAARAARLCAVTRAVPLRVPLRGSGTLPRRPTARTPRCWN